MRDLNDKINEAIEETLSGLTEKDAGEPESESEPEAESEAESDAQQAGVRVEGRREDRVAAPRDPEAGDAQVLELDRLTGLPWTEVDARPLGGQQLRGQLAGAAASRESQ